MGRPESQGQPAQSPQAGPPSGAQVGQGQADATQAPASEEEFQAKMAELRDELAETPVELVVANHCFGMFELAALHLSLQPPRLDQARLAIDALAGLLDAMTGRLGEEEAQLQEGLASLRLAFVQIQGAQASGAGPAPAPASGPAPDPGPAPGPGPVSSPGP